MIKSILLVFLLFFAVVGICEFIYIIRSAVSYPSKRFRNYVFVVLESGHAIEQLKFLWLKIRWQGDEFASGIVAVSDFLQPEEISFCNDFKLEKNILVCKTEDLPKYVDDLFAVYKENYFNE